jgi:hypothetical protein
MKINNIKNFFAAVFLVLGLTLAPVSFAGIAVAQSAEYQPGGQACSGANGEQVIGGSQTCDDGDANSLPEIVAFIINVFSWIIGAVSVIMIIYGGFRYITSGGDSNGVTAAKNTILYAIIGLVIVALAQIIVNFVLNKTSEVTS